MPKYHIGKGGIPRICKAIIRPCPYGGDEAHFTTIEGAQHAADSLNTQLQRLNENQQIGFATVNNNAYVYNSKGVEVASQLLVKTRRTKARIDAAYNYYTQQLLRTLEAENLKKLSDDIGTITYIAPGTKNIVDVDALKAEGIYQDYVKTSHVQEFLTTEQEIENKHLAKVAEDYAKHLKDYTSDDVTFTIEEGRLSPEGKVAFEKLRDLRQKKDALEATEKEVKKRLITSMKEQNLTEYTASGMKFVFVPEHDKEIIDTQALKDAYIYDVYTRQTPVKASLRFKFN